MAQLFSLYTPIANNLNQIFNGKDWLQIIKKTPNGDMRVSIYYV